MTTEQKLKEALRLIAESSHDEAAVNTAQMALDEVEDAECDETPPLASASGSPVWLVLVGEGGEIQTTHICRTEADRDAATIREVFGEISHENVSEGQFLLAELTQEGVLHFEDGNIEWRKVYLANRGISDNDCTAKS